MVVFLGGTKLRESRPNENRQVITRALSFGKRTFLGFRSLGMPARPNRQRQSQWNVREKTVSRKIRREYAMGQ
jgi:hypothetical protein